MRLLGNIFIAILNDGNMKTEHSFVNNSDHTFKEYENIAIPESERNHKSSELFTLWFATNLTIGDFAIGFIPVLLNLSLEMTFLALITGNVFGASLLAYMSKTGPFTGLPQMIAGRRAFGNRFGIFMSGLQWLNTLGWLTVNLVLAAFAFTLAFHIPYYEVSIIVIAIIIFIISFSGRKLISYFEKIMSVVLGIMFSFIIISSLFKISYIYAYKPVYYGFGVAFGITLATSFSYIMSWGPYAADYSRYNKEKNTFIYTFSGGFIASLWAEIAGVFIAILSFNPSGNPAIDLKSVLGPYGIVGLFAIFLGGIAADAINLYSNSVSLKTTGIKMKRFNTVMIGIVVSIILAITTYSKFYSFYEDFLFILDYWITPWIGIMIADFFIINRHREFDTKKIPGFNKSGIFSYFIALLISIPFMDPGVIYEGIISKLYLGGVDISYYVSFIIALLLYPLIKKIINKRTITNNVK